MARCKHEFPVTVDGEEFEDFCRYDADGYALCPKCGKPAVKIMAELKSTLARLKKQLKRKIK